MKHISKLFFLLVAMLFYSHNLDAQTYIPKDNKSANNSKLVLRYFGDGNRPRAEIKFHNGEIFYLMPVCEGEYYWCIRNSGNEEVGYMRIVFSQNKNYATLSIKVNELSQRYLHYLKNMIGQFKRS